MGYIEDLEQKYEWLKNRIASAGKAAAAFSGGVDSVFLLYAAKEALGDQLLALTVSLHAVPRRELQEAKDFCSQHGIRHRIETVDEFSIEGFHFPDLRFGKTGLLQGALDLQLLKRQKPRPVISLIVQVGAFHQRLEVFLLCRLQHPLKQCFFTEITPVGRIVRGVGSVCL